MARSKPPTTPEEYSQARLDRVLDAIWAVESGRRKSDVPDGDGGLAIGPFQIHKAYWQDAAEFDRTLLLVQSLDSVRFYDRANPYKDCRNYDYARRVVIAYGRRYKTLDACGRLPDSAGAEERFARTHNGGPKGATKAATLDYWRKVLAAMR